MTIKRMELQYFMVDPDMLEDLIEDSLSSDPYLEIEPVVHRNGIFKQGKKCWFEVDGRAYTYRADMFDFELGLLNVPALAPSQIKALKMVIDNKLASKEQKKLYETICYNLEGLPRRLDIYKMQKKFSYL